MRLTNKKVVVCGAGGFIGGHLVNFLLAKGIQVVRAVDIKPLEEWYQRSNEVENLVIDLSSKHAAYWAVEGTQVVFHLAANMGGVGFAENNKALGMLNVLIDTHLLDASRKYGVERFFYSSSASVYNPGNQAGVDLAALKEEDAYPALPEDGFGFENLFSERMCLQFGEDFGLQTRIARYHNVYGPFCTWNSGREMAPAAICRKVIEAKLSGRREIEIWGDGEQTRSFMFIDDCTAGTLAILESDIREPINLGTSERVTINQLVDMVEEMAGVKLIRRYNLNAPKGVHGRISDNTKIIEYLGWEPSIRLREGLAKTYAWIESKVLADVAK